MFSTPQPTPTTLLSCLASKRQQLTIRIRRQHQNRRTQELRQSNTRMLDKILMLNSLYDAITQYLLNQKNRIDIVLIDTCEELKNLERAGFILGENWVVVMKKVYEKLEEDEREGNEFALGDREVVAKAQEDVVKIMAALCAHGVVTVEMFERCGMKDFVVRVMMRGQNESNLLLLSQLFTNHEIRAHLLEDREILQLLTQLTRDISNLETTSPQLMRTNIVVLGCWRGLETRWIERVGVETVEALYKIALGVLLSEVQILEAGKEKEKDGDGEHKHKEKEGRKVNETAIVDALISIEHYLVQCHKHILQNQNPNHPLPPPLSFHHDVSPFFTLLSSTLPLAPKLLTLKILTHMAQLSPQSQLQLLSTSSFISLLLPLISSSTYLPHILPLIDQTIYSYPTSPNTYKLISTLVTHHINQGVQLPKHTSKKIWESICCWAGERFGRVKESLNHRDVGIFDDLSKSKEPCEDYEMEVRMWEEAIRFGVCKGGIPHYILYQDNDDIESD